MSDHHFRGIGRHLADQRLSVRNLLQLILNGDLELQNTIGVVWILNLLSDLLRLGVETSLVQGLRVVELVRIDFGVELSQLVIHVS